MLKWARRAGIVLLVALLLSQFYRPAQTNPPTEPGNTLIDRLDPPPAVAQLLKRSCYDCHSHETRWPWYSQVAPASWLVAYDVNEAREHLNLSDWGAYSERAAVHKIEEMCEEVEEGEMPLWFYILLHRDATVRAEELEALCEWAQEVAMFGADG